MATIPCANTQQNAKGKQIPCLKSANNACNGCLLVQYCSKDCQVAHWKVHKLDCKSALMQPDWKPRWEVFKRNPVFIDTSSTVLYLGSTLATESTPHKINKYLWGDVPALNVLGGTQNEALDLGEQLNLLFGASGDVRNVVASLAALPESYAGKCTIVLNDKCFDVVARNAIILLAALHFPTEEAVPIIIHLWYSALIPSSILKSITEGILPLIEDVCGKIKTKPKDSLQSKIWTYGAKSCRLVLQKRYWDRLLSYFVVPDGLSVAHAQKIRSAATLSFETQDYRDRAMFNQPPGWRACLMKFRRDGILMPFGAPRAEFDTPNPTIFQNKETWPMEHSADPIKGWSLQDVLKRAPVAKDDIYGSLYLYLTDLLSKFCDRIAKNPVAFHLYHVDALELPSLLEQSGMSQRYFDRIELSNIIDRDLLGPKRTLETFAPLLQSRSKNPSATIITLFIDASREVTTRSDTIEALRTEVGLLRPYMPLPNPMDPMLASYHKYNDARTLIRDYDVLFERYLNETQLVDVGEAAGLRMRESHKIVECWPMRLKTGAPKADFVILHASGHDGSERYVEWETLE